MLIPSTSPPLCNATQIKHRCQPLCSIVHTPPLLQLPYRLLRPSPPFPSQSTTIIIIYNPLVAYSSRHPFTTLFSQAIADQTYLHFLPTERGYHDMIQAKDVYTVFSQNRYILFPSRPNGYDCVPPHSCGARNKFLNHPSIPPHGDNCSVKERCVHYAGAVMHLENPVQLQGSVKLPALQRVLPQPVCV